MISFSLSSVVISVLCCNMLIVLLSIIVCSNRLLIRIRLRSLLVCIAIILMRMLLPCELPISHNIYYPPWLSLKISDLLCDRTGPGGISFTIAQILLIIWISGFVFLMMCYFIKSDKLYRFITIHGTDISKTDHIKETIQDLMSLVPIHQRVNIYEARFINEPCIIQLKKCYFILLPSDIPFSDIELKSILTHEWMHAADHDLLIRTIVHIICIIYWWNPLCFLLEKQVGQFLELQTDSNIQKNCFIDLHAYLSSLISIASKLSKKGRPLSPTGLNYSTASGKLLQMRFDSLIKRNGHLSKSLGYGLTTLTLIIFTLSYVYIFEPGVYDSEITEGTFSLTSENTYAVKKDDGTYDIYFQNEYWENVDSLQYYPEKMHIYKEGESCCE